MTVIRPIRSPHEYPILDILNHSQLIGIIRKAISEGISITPSKIISKNEFYEVTTIAET